MGKLKLTGLLWLACTLVWGCKSSDDSALQDAGLAGPDGEGSYQRAPAPSFKFKRIPKGSFTMGSPDTEWDRRVGEDEYPVTISRDFDMGATEVTQMQWFSIMGDNPSEFREKKFCPKEHVVVSGTKICPSLPVENVSWDDVQVFLGKLNKRGIGSFRLPTEAEWEYAARAGTTTPFNLGENISPDKVNYNGEEPYKDAPRGLYRHHTVAVGSLNNANSWGLSDMHGNVYEWTSDWHGDYSSAEVTDPKGPRSGSARVTRGGGFVTFARYCRSAERSADIPTSRDSATGFRLVRNIP